jgi:hypothetical protein
VPTTGGGSAALNDFLGGGGDSSGGGGGGGFGGGGGGGVDIPAGDPQSRAQFDTDVAQQRGFTPAIQTVANPMGAMVPATQGALSSAGSPMGGGGMPMGMGGMGGMGGQQGQNNEREPQIWLQADKDAWTDDPEGEGDVVLGRGRTTRT